MAEDDSTPDNDEGHSSRRETTAEQRVKNLAFARVLNRKLVEKGWSQTELAARATNLLPAGTNPVKRHNISSYSTGTNMPNAVKLNAIAKALGCSVTDLVGSRNGTLPGETDDKTELKAIGSGKSRLKIDLELPTNVAVEILQLVHGAQSRP